MVDFFCDRIRFDLLHFPTLRFNKKIVAILSAPTAFRNDNWFSITTSFTSQVWLAILSSYVTLWSVNTLSVRSLRKCLSLAFDYFSVILGKCKHRLNYCRTNCLRWAAIVVKSEERNALLIIWLLSSITLSTYFQSNIRSLLVSNTERSIESLDQLHYEMDIKIMVEKDTSPHKMILNVMKKTLACNFFLEPLSRVIE